MVGGCPKKIGGGGGGQLPGAPKVSTKNENLCPETYASGTYAMQIAEELMRIGTCNNN